MDRIIDGINWYVEIGAVLLAISVLTAIAERIPFTLAVRQEAIRHGLKEQAAITNSVWSNAVYALVFWPVGLWRILKQLFR
jgi:hypothetical protein